jgi:hypothetical protein
MTAHIFEKHTNCRQEGVCPICDGGLSICTVCHLIEGSLTTNCPGKPVWKDLGDSIYAGDLDFRNGEWVNAPSPHSPASVQQSKNTK